MEKYIFAIFTSFLFALIFGKYFIIFLNKINVGKVISETGPKHFHKTGTPQLGGFIFILPVIVFLIISIIFGFINESLFFCMLSAFGFGTIGFIDDYLKIYRRSWQGLTQIQKIVLQFIISLILIVWLYNSITLPKTLILPFSMNKVSITWHHIPIIIVVLMFITSSTNFLDGLDGLLGSCSITILLTQVIIIIIFINKGLIKNMTSIMLFSLILIAGIIAFLFYNLYPAKVFMGDVGSFFLGGAMVGISLVSQALIIYLFSAFIIVITGFSVITQIVYYRLTVGKRLFRMAPLHHHIELMGIKEQYIIAIYIIISSIFSFCSLLMIK